MDITKHPLVTLQEAAGIINAILAEPEKYMIVQSEVDVGSAQMQTFDQPHVYNKVYVNLTFLDKDRIPGGVSPEQH